MRCDEKQFIKEISILLVKRKCTLFAGSGLTADCGGATWTQLIEFLKDKFHYESPLDEPFDVIGDIIKKNSKETIYSTIQQRLKNVKLTKPLSTIASFPWFSVFTTNYDTALENSLDEEQKEFETRRIFSGDEYFLPGIQSEILCIKLMGSVDVGFGQPGQMVLDLADLNKATKERAKIFTILGDYAATLSFLFIGYSFDDEIFSKVLEDIISAVGFLKNKYYAIFYNEPDEKKQYKLNLYNINYIVISNLSKFVEDLSKEFVIRNPKDYTQKKIPIGSEIIIVDSKNLFNFLSKYNPILLEDMENDIDPYHFFKGETFSLKPFELGWHYNRDEITKTIDVVRKSKSKDNNVVIISGNPGVGRTFTILAAVSELIRKYKSVAIKLQNNTRNIIPEVDDLNEFIKEMEVKVKIQQISEPERIILFANFSLSIEDIVKYKKLVNSCKLPLILIYEELPGKISPIGFFLEINETLPNDDIANFTKYLEDCVSNHKFLPIKKQDISHIIKIEKKIFAIMYKLIDPTRRSINTIIQEELAKISDKIARDSISFVSLASSVDIDMPMAVLKRSLGNRYGRFIDFQELFEIINKNSNAFIRTNYDLRGNPIASIYHSIIAQHIIKLSGEKEMDKILIDIGSSVDLISQVESDFIGSLLIDKGVNWTERPGLVRPFTLDGLEGALSKIKDRQPAVPILHHLARLYEKKDIHDQRIIPLLEEALEMSRYRYPLSERKENIMTTLANVKWNQNKSKYKLLIMDSPEIQDIFFLLTSARENYPENVHSYDVQVRILLELIKNKDIKDRFAIANEAIKIIDDGLDHCDNPVSTIMLQQLLVEVISKVNFKEAEETAQLMLAEKNGTGFFTLALIKFHSNNPSEALKYLQKSLEGSYYPPEALLFFIDILINDKHIIDYFNVKKLVDMLSLRSDFKETWKSAFYKAIIYTIFDRYEEAVRFFQFSYAKTPFNFQSFVSVFWMENRRRKELSGRIRNFTEKEGRIESHGIDGWRDTIFFDPRRQINMSKLRVGMSVNFVLGFSPRGPQAFDLEPLKRK